MPARFQFSIASIKSTSVVIVTRDDGWYVLASKLRIATISSTQVVIVTRDRLMFNFSSLGVTPISGTSVIIINNYWTVNTSSSRIARVNCAWVVVVTLNLFKNRSYRFITSNSGTCINWWKRSSDELASLNWVTAVISTDIFIVTNDWSKDTSLFFVARINSTAIVIVTSDWSKDTSKFCITTIFGTCILVVAD
jgi:hypothetical protein